MNNKFVQASMITDRSKQEPKRLSSREVYKMMNLKQHSDLLRKIDSINVDFRESKIAFSKYWVESTYKVEGQTREYREFLITKKGCEFLAHKTTGTKGNLFTDKQIDDLAELVGIRSKNKCDLIQIAKNILVRKYNLSRINSSMEVYKRAKDKIFKEFNVTKWEDIPATKYNAVQAFIEECL